MSLAAFIRNLQNTPPVVRVSSFKPEVFEDVRVGELLDALSLPSERADIVQVLPLAPQPPTITTATPSTGTTYKIPGPWAPQPALDTEEKIEAHLRNISDDKQETLSAAAWKAIAQKDHGGSSISRYVDELERELAFEKDQRATAELVWKRQVNRLSASSARGPTSTFSERDEEEFFLRAQHRNLRKQIEAIVRAHDAFVYDTSKDNAFALKRVIDQGRGIGLTVEERAVSTEEYEDACDENFRRDLKTQYVEERR